MKFSSKYKTVHWRNCIWKYRLRNDGRFGPVGDELNVASLAIGIRHYIRFMQIREQETDAGAVLLMITSSNGSISALLAFCAGISRVAGEFPAQWPVTRSFSIFFHLCLDKRLSKHSWGWWSGTPSRSLWRHCNVSRHCMHLYLARIYLFWLAESNLCGRFY